MAYTNSPLVTYTKISPMKNTTRVHSKYNPNGVIDKITIHHMAGNLSVETCGQVFQVNETSSTYGVGSDGRVAMYVEEKHRPWTSSSPANDYRAITIEVANDGGKPNWHVSDKALAKTIELCVDICKRNGIKKLNYTGDSTGNLTKHNMFTATVCPGPYLESKFQYIADEVNKKLEKKKEEEKKKETTKVDKNTFKVGDIVNYKGGKHYANANATSPASSNRKAGKAKVTSKYNSGKHPYHLVAVSGGSSNVYGWVDCSAIEAPAESSAKKETTSTTLKKGDKVKVKSGAKTYTGGNLASHVYKNTYVISELDSKNGRAVIKTGDTVVAAMNVKDLTKV